MWLCKQRSHAVCQCGSQYVIIHTNCPDVLLFTYDSFSLAVFTSCPFFYRWAPAAWSKIKRLQAWSSLIFPFLWTNGIWTYTQKHVKICNINSDSHNIPIDWVDTGHAVFSSSFFVHSLHFTHTVHPLTSNLPPTQKWIPNWHIMSIVVDCWPLKMWMSGAVMNGTASRIYSDGRRVVVLVAFIWYTDFCVRYVYCEKLLISIPLKRNGNRMDIELLRDHRLLHTPIDSKTKQTPVSHL